MNPEVRDLRNIGDYATGAYISAEQSEELMRWAEEFLTDAEAALDSGPNV